MIMPRSHSRRRTSGPKMLFISTAFMVDFFLTYEDIFGPLSIQESVFHLTVFINPVCPSRPPKKLKL